jgi:hypothetical protein
MTFQERQQAVLQHAANTAIATPRLPNGLWFRDDMRNNLYYAMHLYIAASIEETELIAPKLWAKEFAESILLQLLSLQQRQPEETLYGHFPQWLGDDPSQAAPHVLPVELVGNLLVMFTKKYESYLSEALKEQIHTTLLHVYNSKLAEVPQVYYYHHETKLFSLQVNLGTFFKDDKLIEQGHQHLQAILKRVQTYGFHEYGIMPWLWHWIQSVSCVWETTQQAGIKDTARQLLDWLWTYRAEHALGGAWIGARSRGWPHDLPADNNVLFDYIQFGNCALPERIVRLEAAALIDYDAGDHIRSVANREETEERIRLIPRPAVDENQEPYAEYLYRTKYYAVGGIKEYVREFDNEQMRYQITFPVRTNGSANQAYFFHPGEGYWHGDMRHSSGLGEIMLHKQTAAILFPIQADQEDEIVGSLPIGRWCFETNCLIGDLGDVYLIAQLWQPYEVVTVPSGLNVYSRGKDNGAVLEVISKEDAEKQGIHTLAELSKYVLEHAAQFTVQDNRQNLRYTSFIGQELSLIVDRSTQFAQRYVDGKSVE